MQEMQTKCFLRKLEKITMKVKKQRSGAVAHVHESPAEYTTDIRIGGAGGNCN